jgi:hypothetical protein
MPVGTKDIPRQVVSGVAIALIIGFLGWFWNAASNGGIIRVLGGITSSELSHAVESELAKHPSSLASVGAVVAFALPNGCPDGWTVFGPAVSRVIIGASLDLVSPRNSDARGSPPLSNWTYNTAGGQETHLLTIAEMPSHKHETIILNGGFGTDFKSTDTPRSGFAGNGGNRLPAAYTSEEGGGERHNIMPPFLALYYCQKKVTAPR